MKLTNSVVGRDYITPKDVLHSMISYHMFIFQFRQLSPGPEEADQQCDREGLRLDSCVQDLMELTSSVVRKDYVTPKDALHSMTSNHMFIFQF